jgi:hypothetical protein
MVVLWCDFSHDEANALFWRRSCRRTGIVGRTPFRSYSEALRRQIQLTGALFSAQLVMPWLQWSSRLHKDLERGQRGRALMRPGQIISESLTISLPESSSNEYYLKVEKLKGSVLPRSCREVGVVNPEASTVSVNLWSRDRYLLN